MASQPVDEIISTSNIAEELLSILGSVLNLKHMTAPTAELMVKKIQDSDPNGVLNVVLLVPEKDAEEVSGGNPPKSE